MVFELQHSILFGPKCTFEPEHFLLPLLLLKWPGLCEFHWSENKPLGRLQHNMLNWLVIYLLNNLALFWWAKLNQVIKGFPADNSFSWIKPLVRRRHIKKISNGFPWKVINRNYTTSYNLLIISLKYIFGLGCDNLIYRKNNL